MNVYSWDGLHAIIPELWYGRRPQRAGQPCSTARHGGRHRRCTSRARVAGLTGSPRWRPSRILPTWLPIHPSKMWCHVRQVYLPMSYAFGHRIVAPVSPLIQQLREELYTQPYESIDWPAQRNHVAPVDLYAPHTRLLDALMVVVNLYERWHSSRLRAYALDEALRHIRYDDENTKCISIGPISKVINMLCRWHADGPQSAVFQQHADRVLDYLWLAADGMKMQGTNGSQLWDTAFAAQAYLDAGAGEQPEFHDALRSMYSFLDLTQIKEPVAQHKRCYRQNNKGAFPFSTRDCGWIVADCTAEGLKSMLYLHQCTTLRGSLPPLDMRRIYDGVDVLLSMQNADGGWATYEQQRGSPLLELINPAEVFRDIMIDYSYVECTSACVQALHTVLHHCPPHRRDAIERAIRRGLDYIRGIQRADGSWEGSWGICFTYGTWFGLEALACAGEGYATGDASARVRKACAFLLAKQRPDGAWSESYKSCIERRYIEHEQSQIVNTAWALLGLMAVHYPDREPLRRGVQVRAVPVMRTVARGGCGSPTAAAAVSDGAPASER